MSEPGTSSWLAASARRVVVAILFGVTLGGLGLSAMSIAERRAELKPAPVAIGGVRFYIPSGGGAWVAPTNPGHIAGAFVLLIHGLDEPGDIWDELAPALHDAGHTVARFEYPNDQAVADSGDELMSVLAALGEAGVPRIDIVGHSMGGLVSRDALTRPGVDRAGWAPVRALVMVGTPHLGSVLAPLRGVAELRDRFQRYSEGDATLMESLDFASDGGGQAGRDLTPGSAFLADLNLRPHPPGVRLVCIVGRWAPEWADGSLAIEALGDGVVAVDSATLDGAEIVEVRGNHRGMLLSMPITGDATAIEPIVHALGAP